MLKSSAEGWKRWVLVLGGVTAFVVVGVALIPGIVRYQRTNAADGPPALAVAPAARATAESVPDQSPKAAKEPRSPIATVMGLRDFDCMIAPSEVVQIGSAITGRIDEILVERSDYVERGQVVVKLESTVEKATVRLAEVQAQRDVEIKSSATNYELQKKRQARARKLFNEKSISMEELDLVETEAKLAELDLQRAREDRESRAVKLDQAQAALDRHAIKSPISGFVTDRLMSPGEIVDEETILRIVRVDPLRVEVILPSNMFGEVRPGDRAEVYAESGLDGPVEAEVQIVDPIIDGPSGTFGARLLIPNPDQDLPAGLRCQVHFVEDATAPLARLDTPDTP